MAKAKKIKSVFIALSALLESLAVVFYVWPHFYYKASENAISTLK